VTGYRRRIELVTVSPEDVWGELEDDFHHFRVTVVHRDGKVVASTARPHVIPGPPARTPSRHSRPSSARR
jgi:hypothetical protein